MRNLFIQILTLSLVLVAGTYSETLESEPDFIEQQKMTSNLIVNLFLLDVDKGKLVIFGQKIHRKQINSQQVAYIHNLDDDSLSISIYLRLETPLLIPHFEDYYVDEISVDVDKDGRIQQVTSHVIPME